MATCFGAVCLVWQPPDCLSDQSIVSNISFIGFRVRSIAENQWLSGEQPPTVLLCDGNSDIPTGIESSAVKGDELPSCISQFLSLVGLPSFYLAAVVQLIYSKAAAVAYEAANVGGPVSPTPIIAEIPFLCLFPAQQILQVQEEEDEEEEDENVSIILEEEVMDMDMDIDIDIDIEVDMDKVMPATDASIERLEKFNWKVVNSDEKCTICLEQLSVEYEVSRMPCSHVFHGDCIVQWLKNSHICPLCRFEMPIHPN